MLDARLKEWYGDQAFWISKAPEIRTYTSSFFLRYPIITSDGRKFLLVKIRRRATMRSLTEAILDSGLHVNMRNEYHSLEAIHKVIGTDHDHLGAIRPLAYLENWYALVMEEYPSVSLRELLMRWGVVMGREGSMKTLRDAARKAGRWMHSFHNEFPAGSDTEPTREIMDSLNRYATQLENSSRGAIKAEWLREIFAAKMPLIAAFRLPVSQTHGDMTCDNVLYSRDHKLCTIDVKGRIGPIYSDLALLLIHPETFKLQVFTLGGFFRKSVLRSYRKAIIDGYFGNVFQDTLLINLYCALMLVDKWARYEDNASRYRGIKRIVARLMFPLSRHYFKNRINTYLNATTQADTASA